MYGQRSLRFCINFVNDFGLKAELEVYPTHVKNERVLILTPVWFPRSFKSVSLIQKLNSRAENTIEGPIRVGRPMQVTGTRKK